MKKDHQTTLNKEVKKTVKSGKVIKIKASIDYLNEKVITFDYLGKCIKPNDLRITFSKITNPNNNKEYTIIHFLNLAKCTVSVFNHNNKNYFVASCPANSMEAYNKDSYALCEDLITKCINKAMHGLNFREFCEILKESQRPLKQSEEDKKAKLPVKYVNRYLDKTDSDYYIYKNARIAVWGQFNEIQKTLAKTLNDKAKAKAIEMVNSLDKKASDVA